MSCRQERTRKQLFRISNANDLIVYTQNGTLKSVGTTGTVTTYGATASTQAWTDAGQDADNVYVYRNSGALGSASPTWVILGISRSTQVSKAVATGTGYLASVAQTPTSAFASVVTLSATASQNTVTRYNKPQNWAPNPHLSTSTEVVAYTSLGQGSVMQVRISTAAGNAKSRQILASDGRQLSDQGLSYLEGTESTGYALDSQQFPISALLFVDLIPGNAFGNTILYRAGTATGSLDTPMGFPNGAAFGGTITSGVYADFVASVGDGFTGVTVAGINATSLLLNDATAAIYTFNTKTGKGATRTSPYTGP